MKYKYVRSSTNNIKEIDKQIEAMQAASTDYTVIENNGGGLMAILKKIQTHDIILVSDIDQLANGDANEAIELYQQLLDIGVKVYEKDKEIDLANLINNLKKYGFQ